MLFILDVNLYPMILVVNLYFVYVYCVLVHWCTDLLSTLCYYLLSMSLVDF